MTSDESRPLLTARHLRRSSNLPSLVSSTQDLLALTNISNEDGRLAHQRSLLLDPEFEMELSGLDPEAHRVLTTTLGGILFQVGSLFFCVACYTALPLTINYAKTVGYRADGIAIKRNTFSEISVIAMRTLLCICISTAGALYMDVRGMDSSESTSYVKQLFNIRKIQRWAVCGAGFVLSDLFEMAANGPLDAATYSVLSQSRIVGTAIAMQLFLGISHSWLQWCVLFQLSTLLVCWQLVPRVMLNHMDKHDATARDLGMILVAGKCFLSVTCGTLQQGILHADKHVPFIIQQGQLLIVQGVVCLALVPVSFLVFEPSLNHSSAGNHGATLNFFRGWNHRVLAVLIAYALREYLVSWIIKLYDALVKILCVAACTIPTYIIGAFVLHDIEFSKLRLGLAQAIALAIMIFALPSRAKATNDRMHKSGSESAFEGPESASGA